MAHESATLKFATTQLEESSSRANEFEACKASSSNSNEAQSYGGGIKVNIALAISLPLMSPKGRVQNVKYYPAVSMMEERGAVITIL